jgi:phosphopantetheine--protein transferase-like protein
MLFATGIDIIEIKRFIIWTSYEEKKLLRIFSPQELEDSKKQDKQNYIPEKLAVRFAAKEAFYKALSSLLIQQDFPLKKFYLIESCPHISVTKKIFDIPELNINWSFFEKKTSLLISSNSKTSLSLSHEKNIAAASVIIWSKKI